MKKTLFIVVSLLMAIGLFANPLEKALEKGKWKQISNKDNVTKWTKKELSLTKVSTKGSYSVTLNDSNEQIIFETEDYNNLQQVVTALLDNKDPNVEWKEIKNGVLSGRKLKKKTIAKANADDTATGKREGVSTASSRASEAKEDYEWSDE